MVDADSIEIWLASLDKEQQTLPLKSLFPKTQLPKECESRNFLDLIQLLKESYSPEILGAIKVTYNLLIEQKAYEVLRQKMLGGDQECNVKTLKDFDQEYFNSKDDIVRIFTTIKTKFIADTEQKIELPQLPQQPLEELQLVEFQTLRPEELQMKSDKFDVGAIKKAQTPLINKMAMTVQPPGYTPGAKAKKMLTMKKQELVNEQMKSPLNTAMYRAKRINTNQEEALWPNGKVEEDSIQFKNSLFEDSMIIPPKDIVQEPLHESSADQNANIFTKDFMRKPEKADDGEEESDESEAQTPESAESEESIDETLKSESEEEVSESKDEDPSETEEEEPSESDESKEKLREDDQEESEEDKEEYKEVKIENKEKAEDPTTAYTTKDTSESSEEKKIPCNDLTLEEVKEENTCKNGFRPIGLQLNDCYDFTAENLKDSLDDCEDSSEFDKTLRIMHALDAGNTKNLSLSSLDNGDSLVPYTVNSGSKCSTVIQESTDQSNSELDQENVKIITYLGSGGEGRVYLAKILALNEFVAMKQFEIKTDQGNHKKALKMLLNEVNLVKSFKHPNIIEYYALRRSNYKNLQNTIEYNLIMEYMEGGSLAELVKASGNGLPKDRIRLIVRQILNGLKYLHAHNVIHRDLKPGNILMNKEETEFKITDFGISTQVKENLTNVKRTFVGTPWYMAPEVILDEPYSYAADVWSLGCLCFELFCGEKPYAAFGGMQAMFQMIKHASPIESCDEEKKKFFQAPDNADIMEFLNQCWVARPTDRPDASTLLNLAFLKRDERKEKVKRVGHLVQVKPAQKVMSEINFGAVVETKSPAKKLTKIQSTERKHKGPNRNSGARFYGAQRKTKKPEPNFANNLHITGGGIEVKRQANKNSPLNATKK